ncbi:MAG: energy transducer TonB [Acidobacteriota bacterium]|nr:energy transducer TonB [Acidobacteriota bacterium]
MRINRVVAQAAMATLALALVTPPIYASEGNKQQQAIGLFSRAYKLTNIWAKGSPGFVMDAQATIYGRAGTSEAGSYRLIWKSDGESVTDIEFPDYHSITVNHAGKTWSSSTSVYLPYPVFQLKRIADPLLSLMLLRSEKLKKISNRKIGGTPAVCPSFAEQKTHGLHEYCFAQATGYLIQENDPKWLTTFEFGDYAPFGGKVFPRNLRVVQSGQLIVDAKVTSIASDPKMDAAALVVPPGVQPSPIPHCSEDQPEHVKAIFQPAPHYPSHGLINRITGTVVIYADIGKDGIPRGLTVLASPGPGFSQSALASVGQWRYQPPACNGIPMEAFSAIEVHYTMRE